VVGLTAAEGALTLKGGGRSGAAEGGAGYSLGGRWLSPALVLPEDDDPAAAGTSGSSLAAFEEAIRAATGSRSPGSHGSKGLHQAVVKFRYRPEVPAAMPVAAAEGGGVEAGGGGEGGKLTVRASGLRAHLAPTPVARLAAYLTGEDFLGCLNEPELPGPRELPAAAPSSSAAAAPPGLAIEVSMRGVVVSLPVEDDSPLGEVSRPRHRPRHRCLHGRH